MSTWNTALRRWPAATHRRWVCGRASRRLHLARYWHGHDDLDEAARHGHHALRLMQESEAAPWPLLADILLTVARIDGDRAWYDASRSRLERCVRLLDGMPAAPDRDRRLAPALVGLGDLYRRTGRSTDAGRVLDRARRLIEAGVKPDPASLASVHAALGIAAKEQGDFEAAAAHYRRVERLQIDIGAPAGAAAALAHNLAGLAYAQRRYALAEEHAKRAVTLRQRDRRATPVALAEDQAVLAAALAGQGRHAEARTLLARAMAICQAARPPRHYEVAVHLHNLAAIHQAVGEPAQAERLYRQALTMKERLLAPDHPEVGLVANNLGTLLHELGRHPEAADCYQRALAILKRAFPADHPTAEAVRHNLRRLDPSCCA